MIFIYTKISIIHFSTLKQNNEHTKWNNVLFYENSKKADLFIKPSNSILLLLCIIHNLE